jgi:hypothetical protein
MVIEEKLRHKQMHLKQVIDEYTHLKEKYENGKRDNMDEEINNYGIARNAEAFFSVLEAIDLNSDHISGRIDPFCMISLDGKELSTHYKEDTKSPIWNEDLNL